MAKAVGNSHFNLLRIFLIFSALAGCFPTAYPFGNPVKFGFKWLNVSTLYAVVILGFTVTSSINYFIFGLPTFVNETFGKFMANVICGYMDSINSLTGAIFARIFAIIYCARTIELIRIIQNLKSEIIESKLSAHNESIQQGNEVSYPRKDSVIRKLSLNQKPFSSRKVYLILWVTILLHFISNTTLLTKFVASHQSSVSSSLLLLPHGYEWASLALWGLNNLSATIAYCFSLPVGVILGVELISLYHKFKSILLNTLLGDNPALKNQEDREHFMTAFKTLMDGFALFSEVAGTFALINIVGATIALGQSLYQLVDFGNSRIEIELISLVIVRFFWFYNQASIGELIKFHMDEGREEIRNALAFGPKLSRTENVREIAEWMAGWKWKLTACNIFNIDRSLMLGVLQTVMTYVIFLFQLKLSDKPS